MMYRIKVFGHMSCTAALFEFLPWLCMENAEMGGWCDTMVDSQKVSYEVIIQSSRTFLCNLMKTCTDTHAKKIIYIYDHSNETEMYYTLGKTYEQLFTCVL